jgi:hypothetical protein
MSTQNDIHYQGLVPSQRMGLRLIFHFEIILEHEVDIDMRQIKNDFGTKD